MAPDILSEKKPEILNTPEVPATAPTIASAPETAPPPPPVAVVVPELPSLPEATAETTDDLEKEVEEILSDDLGEMYNNLLPDKKTLFKKTGEQLVAQITAAVRGGVLEYTKILALIVAWLSIIPGVNEFFLEQEAKTKTDRLIALFEVQHPQL